MQYFYVHNTGNTLKVFTPVQVERNSEGKEVRYPVILSNKEKLIARKVCLAFKQMVCGFDLLR
jgi:hypothetical protein